MALVLKDRVKQTAAAPGTGTITLGATAAGFQSFASVGNGNTTYYAIVDPVSGDWEVNYGVYTSSGTTLTRNATPLSSSTGTLVNFTGTVDVFLTYPSEKAVWQDLSGVVAQQSFGAITATSAALTSGTITTAPVNATDIVNKEYADSIASGLNYHQPVNYGSTAALPAYTYNNGSSGVGATITANANGALSLGGGSPTATQRVLIKDEVSGNAPYNGVYVVTQAGSAGTPFILTRATDYDTSGTGTNEIDQGDYVLVISGTLASTAWVQQTPLPITVGTTALTFLQFNAPITYTAGTGLNLSPATTFNISNTGVTASTYGSASAVPVFAVNAQGQITSVTNTNIAISGSAVSGNISGSAGSVANSLTLGTYLTGGTYNGSAAVTATVDATSANTASKVVARDSSGNFSAGTITATLSGSATSATTATNLAGGAANQIAYQSASGTTSFATAPSASNQVLSWNGSAFTWSAGTISGVPLGSNLNSLTAGTYLTGTAYNGSAAQTWTVDATSANTASKVVARDASGNFSAGTITAALSGNATSATNSTTTSQTNFSNLTIGGSQVLYAGNYNSYAPTLTGTGASGTWGISISGNAATATSATTATTSTYTTYINNISLGTGSVNVNYGSSAVLRIDGGSGAALQYAPLLHVAAGDTMWQAQGSYGSSGDGTLYFRQGYNGSWGNWLTMLSSYNYNSYAPTLTGTGASGTWNISITGSAGSAPGYLPLSGGTMTGTITGGSGVSSLVTGNYAGALRGYLYNDSSGFGFLTYAGNWGVRVDYGTNSVYIPGIGYSAASLRAPIFYDTDNTSYYVDPASSSSLYALYTYYYRRQGGGYGYLDGGYGSQETGATSGPIYTIGGSYVPGTTSLGNMYGVGYTLGNISGIGIIADWGFYVASNGTARHFLDSDTGTGYSTGSYRAPIFYDYNNTGYYVDPASTSNISATYIGGHLYTSYNGYNPLIRASAAGASGLLVQDSTAAFRFQLYGDGTNYGFLGGAWASWDFRKVNGGALFLNNQGTYYYDADVTYVYRVYGAADMRSPIYYDLNNTGYYVDPASYSYMYEVAGASYVYGGYLRSGTNVYTDQNYGYGLVGAYSSYRYQGVYAMGDAYKLPPDGATTGNLYGMAWSHPNAGGAAGNLNSHGLLLLQNGSFMAALSTNGTFSADVRGTIFYDYNNTGYYIDPASSSSLNTIYQVGVYTRNAAGVGYLSGNYSSSETAYTTGAIYTIGGSYYPTSTSFNTMYGIGYCYAPYISVGISGAGGWGLYVNGSGVNNVWLGGETGQVISTGDHRGTIFYDYNNTGYYVDPASTSILNVLNCYGNVTAYYSSDIKFKTNVRDIPNAIETVESIGGKLFDWTDEYLEEHGGEDPYFMRKEDFGVVAQDVLKVFPVAVRTRPDGSLAVDYEKLSALAFAAVAELSTRVKSLEARI